MELAILADRANKFHFDSTRKTLTIFFTIPSDGGIYRIDTIRVARINGVFMIDLLATTYIELILICKFCYAT